MRTILTIVVLLITLAVSTSCTPWTFGLGVYQLAVFAIEHGDPKIEPKESPHHDHSIMEANRDLIKP
jgi:hypothetical protein